MRLLTFIGNDTAGDDEALIRYTAPIDLRFYDKPVIEIDGDRLDGDLTITIELGVDHNMLAAQGVHAVSLKRNTPLPQMWALDTALLQDMYPLMPYLRLKAETTHGLQRAYVGVLTEKDLACVF